MQTKMGRPTLPKGQAKGVLIGARFSPDEAKQVKLAAKHANQTKSQWVRKILLLATQDDKLGQQV
jgi:hypothetical protein